MILSLLMHEHEYLPFIYLFDFIHHIKSCIFSHMDLIHTLLGLYLSILLLEWLCKWYCVLNFEFHLYLEGI